ncbi:RagB/SusD family nutrient uptake outer membrane protein [Mucilaginibacter daejeonensis]|uniref:RagB/SusD family nutrient uptake outer membrane protein n=1 Tax=Mucilaginibacter daejeonensis TaxID=398049 RepID=UPI001D177579|nr:RagB/SusD family nutrient uptake outer membrane protein [Mucilaginibacter daejeonensis]UEG54822.1 RagB/SusD family nutrient uptake outer membrane protein [Mucilaginibacter daejeonensis]
MNLKYTIKAFFVVAVLTLSACSDDFFETSPSGDLTGSETYSSTKNIDALINGTLRYLMETSTSQDNPGLSAITLTHEVMGEDAIARDGVYGFRDSYPYRDPFDNTTRRALFFWSFQYKVIDNCNNILANVDAASGTEAERRYLKGQAYVLRGFVYLNLVRQYQFTYAKDRNAKAVPVYTKPTDPTSAPKARATVQEVYDQVIGDLTQAETLLAGFTRKVKNRPDVNVVKGLLARAYLTQENWSLAATKAREARSGYSIMEAAQYTQGFNDVSNVEWIWGHPQQADQNLGGASYFAYIDVTPAAGYRSIMPDPYFRQLFADGDIRKTLFDVVTTSTDPLYRWIRYKKFINKADQSGHIVLMRSSEMALIEAEAKARQSDLAGAVSALNELRVKRNLPAVAAASYTQTQLIDEILTERRRELWGEGFRLYDLLRTQRAPVRKESVETVRVGSADVVIKGHYVLKFPDNSNLVPNSPYYLFPIPVNEYNTNPNL